MNTRIRRLLVAAVAALCLCGGTLPAAAFSFDEMETIDRAEQGELLEAAKKAAAAEDFARARRLIEQARNKHHAPQAVAVAENAVRQAEAARDERLRREEQARLARAREEERRAPPEAVGSGSGYTYQYSCTFCCEGEFGFCVNDKMKVKTPETNSMNAQDYVRREYKKMCERFPFYKSGGGSARVGYPSCN